MDKMNDLSDLLKHEVQDLFSAEEQIIAAMPLMIEKASNRELKKALQNHLKITHKQLSRLEQVRNTMGIEQESEEKKGLFSRLFKTRQVCKGMQGIIEEGNKIMKEDMDADVLDAVIIASAQKIEHYEICGYGTARTYATELGLNEVSLILEETLNEEYQADDLLTKLAVTRVNKDAETRSRVKKNREMEGDQNATTQRTRSREPEMEMVSDQRRGNETNIRKPVSENDSPQNKEGTRATSSQARSTNAKRSTPGREKSTARSTQVNRRETNKGKGGRTSGSDSRTR